MFANCRSEVPAEMLRVRVRTSGLRWWDEGGCCTAQSQNSHHQILLGRSFYVFFFSSISKGRIFHHAICHGFFAISNHPGCFHLFRISEQMGLQTLKQSLELGLIWAAERISEYRYYEVYTRDYGRDGNSNGESSAQSVVKCPPFIARFRLQMHFQNIATSGIRRSRT